MQRMYNRYIPDSAVYRPVAEEERREAHRPPPPPSAPGGGAAGWPGGLLKGFHLGSMDMGDILVLLIILLLLLEGDDELEVLITLGLLLLSGLFGGQDAPTT